MVLLWSCCAVISEKVRTSRLTWTSAWDAPAWGGWLARARLIDSPPARLLTSARDLFLKPFPSIELSPPCSSFPGGDDWASGGAICPVFAQPFAGDERILQVCPPLLFPSAVRDGAPQTLTKLFVFGSESSYNILLTSISFARIIGCSMLGPPLSSMF